MKKIIVFILIITIYSLITNCNLNQNIMQLANREITLPEVNEDPIFTFNQNEDPLKRRPFITLHFSMPMNTETVEKNLSLKWAGVFNTSFISSWTNQTTLTIHPENDLVDQAPYVIQIGKDSKNLIDLGLRNDYIFSFNVDFLAPEINSTFPVNGETRVSVIPQIIITFSQMMNHDSIFKPLDNGEYSGAFELKDIRGLKVNKISGYWDENILNLTPLNQLNPFEKYWINISTTAASITGNKIQSPFSSYFTIAGEYIYTGQFSIPNAQGLDFNSPQYNDLYVIDNSNDCIQKYETNQTKIIEWPLSAKNALDLAVNRTDEIEYLFVAASDEHRILKFTPEGLLYGWLGQGENTSEIWHNWDSPDKPLPGSGNGAFNYPSGLAFDSSGLLYVTDSSNDRIQVFDKNFTYLFQWGANGKNDGLFNHPTGIDISSNGEVFIVDSGHHRIQKFSKSGIFKDKWGEWGTGEGQFINPSSIHISADNYVFVTDTGNCRIQIFNLEGNFITVFGSNGTNAGQFKAPYDITTDSSGYVYVSDQVNQNVQIFKAIGK